MGIGDKKKALMEADKGVPGGVAALDNNGGLTLNGRLYSTTDGGSTHAELFGGNGAAYLTAYGDDYNSRRVFVVNNTAADDVNAIQFVTFENGEVVGSRAVYHTGNKPASLKNAVKFRVNLSSTDAVDFDGSANCYPGVTGVLPVLLGGTGCQTIEQLRDALKAIWDD